MALLRDIVLLIWITAATGLVCDEKAIPLPHLKLRSRLDIASVAQTPTNDNHLIEEWYSTVSDGDPTKQYVMTNGSVIPDRFACNAFYSIYLKGDHPVLEDGKEIEAVTCMRTHSEECSDESSVNIRRCSGFYEYKLKPTTANAAYCFDREDIENGDAPGSDVVGTPAVEVKLLYDSKETDAGTLHTPRLEFYCNFNIGDLFYLVSWYVNDQLMETIGPHSTDVKAATKLTEKMLTDKGYTLGISIRCSVMAAKTLTGERNDPKFSSDFFAGIRILYSESKLNLTKGEEGSIVMENTVPVGCEELQKFGFDCGLSVAMYDPTDDNDCQQTTLSVLGNSRFCSADIKAFNYSQLTECQHHDTCDEMQYKKFYMRVTTRNDAKTEEGYNFILRLQTANTQHKIWKDYFISDVPVYLEHKGWGGGHCFSRTDPHQISSDGMYYENQQSGHFILYRNKEHNIEVQQTTIPCLTAFCNCDVTIRADATVFHYSVCNKAIPFIDYLRCDDDALDVRKISDGKYQVHTPIGSIIEIRERRWRGGLYLDIEITMSPKDLNKTDGLCGYFNNNILGDLVKSDGTVFPDSPTLSTPSHRYDAREFASSWVVEKVSKDLRDPDVVTGLQSSLSGEQTLCVCPFIKQKGTTISPIPNTGTNNIALCSTSDFLTCTKPPFTGTPKSCKRFIRRRKRSTDEDRARFRREQFYHRHHLVKKSVDESEGTEGDMQTGQDLCMDYLQAQNDYQTLNTSMPSSEATKSFIYTCAADYAILGYLDPELTRGHYQGLKYDIMIEIERNLIFSKANPELIKTFTDNNCPYDCNEHGTCVKGKCQCTADYGGSACDTKKSDPINVAEVSGGSLCNRELEDCETVLLRASIVHDTVTSKVEVTRVFGDGTPDVTEATSFTCVPDSSYAAECQVPSFRRKRSTISPTPLYIKFTLYLSNDGLTYIGNPGTFIVYSLPCLKSVTLATGESAMEVQDGYCIIDGICRSNSETNSEKSCLSCDSGKNKFVWTDGCDSASKLDLPLIIGLSAAGFLVLCAIAIITGCCLFKKYHDRKRCTTPVVMFEPPGNTHYVDHLSDDNMLRQHGKVKEDVQHIEREKTKSEIHLIL